MKSEEIYNNYIKAFSERWELEKKIEKLMEQWVKGEITLSSISIQQAVDKGYERLENLKQLEESLHQEYLEQITKDNAKSSADNYLGYHNNMRPSSAVITGGVLSSDASKSHLTSRSKTKEELEMEMQQQLNAIQMKHQNGELSLEEATKLMEAMNTSYGYLIEEADEITRH